MNDPVTGINPKHDFETGKARMDQLHKRIGECIEAAKDAGIDPAGIEVALVTHAAWLIAEVDNDEAREFRMQTFCRDLHEQVEFYRTGVFPDSVVHMSANLFRQMREAWKK